jgi:ribosomal protein S18 acetylase RimI-like enzyme
VHRAAFKRQWLSFEWLECDFNAFPRFLCFIAQNDNEILGYITWSHKSGLRPEAVLELEQLAVLPKYQGKGIDRKLIEGPLPLVKIQLAKQNAILKHVIVSSPIDNHAQALYQSTLGAEVEATIENLYSEDDVFMVARNI